MMILWFSVENSRCNPSSSFIMTIRQKISVILLISVSSFIGCATPLYQMPSGYSSTYVKAAQVTPVEITPLRKKELHSH
ncbi:hypothetical protein [Rubinisphaera sp.]|uniref:hypothetical protein n=1 Tax=Rubinisphaera sp. TaxID=2024857 RepID=UPI0025E25902|nr:hypothetical protein [Rubinisphaera sp.]|tara:strand:- start:269 stop:505 length:237 start_codon:yes stop_codon:yes gene_type:complete